MPEIFNSAAQPSSSDTQIQPVVAVSAASSEKESKKKLSRHVDEYSLVMRQATPSSSSLKAYTAKPTDTFFDSQQRDEVVLLLLRQHPVTQVKWVFIGIILALVPFLLSFVGFLEFLPLRFQFVATLGWYLLVFGYSLEAFLNWFYNVYIITDERVIDVDFHSLLFKNVSYAKIDNIEDISATTSGALGSIFDYGTVRIQTAGAVTEFDFEHVPHPSRVTAFLNELLLEEEQENLDGRAN